VSDRYQEVYLPIPQEEEFRKGLDKAVQKRAEGFETLVESISSKMGRAEQESEEDTEEDQIYCLS